MVFFRVIIVDPNRGLGGRGPMMYLDTDIGAEQIDDVLTRLGIPRA